MRRVERPPLEDDPDRLPVSQKSDVRDAEPGKVVDVVRPEADLAVRGAEKNHHHRHVRSFQVEKASVTKLGRKHLRDHRGAPSLSSSATLAASSARLRTPAFLKMFETCRSTVFRERKSRCAISGLLAPSETSREISRSRSVSDAPPEPRRQVRTPSLRSACSASSTTVAAPRSEAAATTPSSSATARGLRAAASALPRSSRIHSDARSYGELSARGRAAPRLSARAESSTSASAPACRRRIS